MTGRWGRFVLFYGPEYYPLGGWKDCKAFFDDLDEAIAHGNALLARHMANPDGNGFWWHVLEVAPHMIVGEGRAP